MESKHLIKETVFKHWAPKPSFKQEKFALILPYYVSITAIHLWSHYIDLCAKTFTQAKNRFICSCSSLPCCFTAMLTRVFMPPPTYVFQVAANHPLALKQHCNKRKVTGRFSLSFYFLSPCHQ